MYFTFYILHFTFYILHFTVDIWQLTFDTDTSAQSCINITDGFSGYSVIWKIDTYSLTQCGLRDASASKNPEIDLNVTVSSLWRHACLGGHWITGLLLGTFALRGTRTNKLITLIIFPLKFVIVRIERQNIVGAKYSIKLSCMNIEKITQIFLLEYEEKKRKNKQRNSSALVWLSKKKIRLCQAECIIEEYPPRKKGTYWDMVKLQHLWN